MLKVKRTNPRLQKLAADELVNLQDRFYLAVEALEKIRDLDLDCSCGPGKDGFVIAGYVARLALERINQ